MRAVILAVLLGLSMFSHAVIVSDLYQVRISVTDQSEESRQTAIQEALLQVVVKVSGQRDNAQNEQVLGAAAAAERYIRSFRYIRDDSETGLRLEVDFAANLIDQLLRSGQLPVWGKSRPLVLVWLGVEDNLQRIRVTPAVDVWHSAMESAANERGIPLLWPAYDLEDDVALPVESLWGMFKTDILQASQRYMADATLAGRLTPDGQGGWQFRGFLQHKGDNLELTASAEEHAVVLRQVADQVASFMAARYAVLNDGTSGGYQLIIDGVADFHAYQNILTYLKANVAINDVKIISVNGQTLTLELDLAAEWNQVWTTLALDKRLLPTEQESIYHWRH